MQRRPHHTIAALLITASLSVPGAALASSPDGIPVPAAAAESGPKAAVDPANLKISRQQAVTIARNLFAIPEALGEPNVSVNQSGEGATWSLQFQNTGSQRERINIGVDVDAQTGAILRYSRWAESPAQQEAALRYTRAEAEEKARYWLDMLAPALRDSLKLAENPNGYGYYGPGSLIYEFRWNRIAEGYPTRDDGVKIVIDARTGELREFNRAKWQKRSYQLPETILPKAKAEAAYREQVPMQLSYQYFYQPGTGTGEWRLVYRPQLGQYPMVGQDGRLLDHMGEPVDIGAYLPAKLVPAPDKPYKAPAKALTREEALALARSVTGRTDEPSTANYHESGEEQQYRSWEFTWQTQGKEQESEYFSVQVDVERGVIGSYNNWSSFQPMKEGEQPKFSEAQAREAAVAFIRTHRPDLAGNLVLMPDEESRNPYYRAKMAGMPRPNYFVRFMLMKNGIPVSDRQIGLNVDAMSGKVRSFWGSELSRTEEFPAAKPAMTPAAAMEAFLKHQGLELAWVQFWTPPMPGKAPQERAPELVWAPALTSGMPVIDAVSGALLDPQGRDLLEAAKRPADIDGHFAQREIELLWARGVFELKDGKFNPNQVATAGDLARWLVMARGMGPYVAYDFRGAFAGRFAGEMAVKRIAASPAAPYLGAALQAGIILPEDFGQDANPEAPVSRELLALWAARAMGYGAVAKMPNRIEMPFADRGAIGARYANAVALLHGLGIIKGDSAATFDPQRAATRGEAAKILFAVASELQR